MLSLHAMVGIIPLKSNSHRMTGRVLFHVTLRRGTALTHAITDLVHGTVTAKVAYVPVDDNSANGYTPEVGRCRLPVSRPVLNAPIVSALETIMNRFQRLLSISTYAATPRLRIRARPTP